MKNRENFINEVEVMYLILNFDKNVSRNVLSCNIGGEIV